MKAKRYGISQRNKARGSRVWYGRESDPGHGRAALGLSRHGKQVRRTGMAREEAGGEVSPA